MPANILRIEGVRVDSFPEFLRAEAHSQWTNVLFYPGTFEGVNGKHLSFKNKKFNFVSFKDTTFNKVRFIRCTFESCIFMGAVFNNCQFTDCIFTNTNTNTNKIKLIDCLLDPKSFDDNFDLINDTNIAINLYQELYKNSAREYQSDHALYSLYKKKNSEYHHFRSQLERGVITEKEYNKQRILYYFHDFISGYGLKTFNVVRLLAILIILFSLMNYIFNSFIFDSSVDFSLIDSFYFTCVTITTLGFGDITPCTAIGKLIVSIQAMLGFVVLSLFMASVVNKAVKAV
ncbi:hypothetical protein FHC51_05945 [Leclercia sp. EC_58]|uniref:ion channel n=1 Tax=Leclercia sp. EC_58 TaxID=2584090 RepID=UPI001C70919E|nr:ion channel [Leclercia sp. EC_58]MBW9399367.1 hypothetical protein [Leclercia sp. EC_58]